MALAALSLALLAAPAVAATRAKKTQATNGSISGTVIGVGRRNGERRSKARPEAGVWVIAETEDLPTKYAKIVVTDERGRFLIPELPKASYLVWARGYGLVVVAKWSAMGSGV